MDGQANLELDQPRTIGEMLSGALGLYRRLPVLFLAFAAIVVVPYELIVLAITGAGPLAQGHLAFFPARGLAVADSFIVTPVISALHVYAVRELSDGGRPTFAGTFRRSVPRLPVVAVAAGISGILISLGSLAFVIPGFLLLLIWPVVAQAAALETGGPIDALRRSFNLTRGHRWHGFGLVFWAGLITILPSGILFVIFRHTPTNPGSFIAGTAVQVVVRSFEALATGLLYFDLLARERLGPGSPVQFHRAATAAASVPPQPTGHPIDPLSWSDDDRPAGWYVNPAQPKRMIYWSTDGPGAVGAWSERSAKTPKQTLAEWEHLRESAENRV